MANFEFYMFDFKNINNVQCNLSFGERNFFQTFPVEKQQEIIKFSIDDIRSVPCYIEFLFMDRNRIVERFYCMVNNRNAVYKFYQLSGRWIVNSEFNNEFIKEIIITPQTKDEIKKIDQTFIGHYAEIITNKRKYINIPLLYGCVDEKLFLYTAETDMNKICINIPSNLFVLNGKPYIDICNYNFINKRDKYNNFDIDLIVFQSEGKEVEKTRIRKQDIDIYYNQIQKIKQDTYSIKTQKNENILDNVSVIMFNYTCKLKHFIFCSDIGNEILVSRMIFNNIKTKRVKIRRKS